MVTIENHSVVQFAMMINLEGERVESGMDLGVAVPLSKHCYCSQLWIVSLTNYWITFFFLFYTVPGGGRVSTVVA